MPRIPEVVVFENDNRCYDLRKAGLTYRQIANALDCSEARAYNGVNRVMRRISAKQAEDGADILRLELERLDALLSNMWSMTMPHDIETEDGGKIRVPPSYEAVDRVIKIMDRRAKLLGLDQIQLNINTSNAQAGVTPAGVTTGASGEITPGDEAMKLLKVMADAGVIDNDVARALRIAVGVPEDIVDAEVVADTSMPELNMPSDDDGMPFFEGMSDDDASAD